LNALGVEKLRWLERRRYFVDCNWKVYVDNYLDGGYHVPHLHRGLNSVLAPGKYQVEVGARYCWQTAEMDSDTATSATRAVRQGNSAVYCWIYPNFMINYYQGVMDTNLVRPLDGARCEVIFDYYFADTGPDSLDANQASIQVSETRAARPAFALLRERKTLGPPRSR
jgi:choline monooxygenase